MDEKLRTVNYFLFKIVSFCDMCLETQVTCQRMLSPPFLPRNQVSSCSHSRFTKTICFFTTQKQHLPNLKVLSISIFRWQKNQGSLKLFFRKKSFFLSIFSQHCFFLETFSNSKLALKVSYVWENRNSCSKSLEFLCFFLTKTRFHFYFC